MFAVQELVEFVWWQRCEQTEYHERRLHDKETDDDFYRSLGEHEQLFDSCPGQVKNAREKIYMPEWITSIGEDAFEEGLNLMVFWPEPCLVRHKVEYNEEELQVYKKENGLWRDKLYGEPSGSRTQT